MRTNGFILVVLVSVAAALAGSPGYLPKVGPMVLHFQKARDTSSTPSERAAVLPPLYPPIPIEEPTPEVNPIPAEPGTGSTNMVSNPPEAAPVVLEISAVAPTNSPSQPAGPLIGPSSDTNGIISPQIFLRYFTPSRRGPSTEAIIVPPTEFNPAQPPMAPSSSATYSQPEP